MFFYLKNSFLCLNFNIINKLIILLINNNFNFLICVLILHNLFYIFNILNIYIFIYYLLLISVAKFNFKISLNFKIGWFRFHTICLYYSILSSFAKFINKTFFLYFKINFFNVTALIGFSFILGALWSLVNSIWGYFWTNDVIEWLLYLTIIQLLYYLHKLNYWNNLYNLFIIFVNFFFFYLIRNNLLYTKQNFFLTTKF